MQTLSQYSARPGTLYKHIDSGTYFCCSIRSLSSSACLLSSSSLLSLSSSSSLRLSSSCLCRSLSSSSCRWRSSSSFLRCSKVMNEMRNSVNVSLNTTMQQLSNTPLFIYKFCSRPHVGQTEPGSLFRLCSRGISPYLLLSCSSRSILCDVT